MACESRDGGAVIVCTRRGKALKCSECGRPGGDKLCDGPLKNGEGRVVPGRTCRVTLGPLSPRLSAVAARRGRVRSLHREGLTNRQLADRLNASTATINSDLRALGLRPNLEPGWDFRTGTQTFQRRKNRERRLPREAVRRV